MTSYDPASRDRAADLPADNALTVYFDGSCPLCTAEITYYASREGGNALRLVDVSDAAADTGTDLDQGAAKRRFHIRRPDGSLLSGAAGFAEVWQTLPGWRPAGRLARLWPIGILLEAGYRLFLPLRPVLSRLARR
jgi:predicted DCC family thiol-disulfide oxidoreductase YuxK